MVEHSIAEYIKWADLSDKMRWESNGYDLGWADELEEGDIQIIKNLKRVGEGELTGVGSTVLFNNLVMQDVPKDHRYEVAEWLMYFPILVYEEIRHGVMLKSLFNKIEGKGNYIEQTSIKEVGEKYVFEWEDNIHWDSYGLLMSHCLSEATNAHLYKSIVNRIKHPKFKELILNLQKDEFRHLTIISKIVKRLINSDEYHKQRCLSSIHKALNHHNAMQHENYVDGLNASLPVFENGSATKIVKKKFKILEDWFGDDNPYTFLSLLKEHISFLTMVSGKTKNFACMEKDKEICLR